MSGANEGLARALEAHEAWLRKQPGVVGVELSRDPEGHPCLEVVTASMLHVVRQVIQRRLAGIPLQFREQGSPRPGSPSLRPPAGPGFWLAGEGDRVRLSEDGSPMP